MRPMRIEGIVATASAGLDLYRVGWNPYLAWGNSESLALNG